MLAVPSTGVAKTTAALVRLGQLPLVRDTVAVACEGGRADVVAAVTMALLALREVCIVTQINNALVSAGQLAAGAKITGVCTLLCSSAAHTIVQLPFLPRRRVGSHHVC